MQMEQSAKAAQKLEVKGLSLETLFASVQDMLAAVCPQTWLPYQLLWPFWRSHWNTKRALSQIGVSIMRLPTPSCNLVETNRYHRYIKRHWKISVRLAKRS